MSESLSLTDNSEPTKPIDFAIQASIRRIAEQTTEAHRPVLDALKHNIMQRLDLIDDQQLPATRVQASIPVESGTNAEVTSIEAELARLKERYDKGGRHAKWVIHHIDWAIRHFYNDKSVVSMLYPGLTLKDLHYMQDIIDGWEVDRAEHESRSVVGGVVSNLRERLRKWRRS